MAKAFLPISRHQFAPGCELVIAGSGSVFRCGGKAARLDRMATGAMVDRCQPGVGISVADLSGGVARCEHWASPFEMDTLACVLKSRRSFSAGDCSREGGILTIAALPPREELVWQPLGATPTNLFTMTAISSAAGGPGGAVITWELGGHGLSRSFTVSPDEVGVVVRELTHGDTDKSIIAARPMDDDQLQLIRRGGACIVRRSAARSFADWLPGILQQ